MLFFGKKQKQQKDICVLLDSTTSRVLARGYMDGPPDGINIQLDIFEGNIQSVVNAEHVQIVPANEDIPPKLGHVIHRQGNLVVLEPTRELTGAQVRENLRMPVDFETFVYHTDGTAGRLKVKGNDLSCGGISFYSMGELEVGELVQVVIPITRTAPLLLDCELLRKKREVDGTFYAAKYLDLLPEQESMIREAVFNVQLKTMQRGRA